MALKSDFLNLQPDVYINSLNLYAYNPDIASTGGSVRTFYGHLCSNALENYLNAFVHPAGATVTSGQTVLSLRAGTLQQNDQNIIVQLVSTNTYFVNWSNVNFAIVCANLDWANLPEEILFDLGSLVSGRVPAQFFKSLYFYVKPTLYEPVTRMADLVIDGRLGLLEGLYITQNDQWAVFGFQNFDLRDTMTPIDRVHLKVAISAPVSSAVASTASPFAARKFCAYADPTYMFADLDRSIKLGAADLEVLATDRKVCSLIFLLNVLFFLILTKKIFCV